MVGDGAAAAALDPDLDRRPRGPAAAAAPPPRGRPRPGRPARGAPPGRPAEPRQRQQVADQALQARRLAADDRRGLPRLDGAVLDPLGVAADRGERGAQVVGDREQHRALGVAREGELLRHAVEGVGQLVQLLGPLAGAPAGVAARGELPGGAAERAQRLGQAAGEQRGDRRRRPRRDAAGDQQRREVARKSSPETTSGRVTSTTERPARRAAKI